ncbi:MAG: cation transporter [Thiomicrorhabdus sp.]|nr:cation transporter [Thiomicrorhabdus sp.]
MKFFYLALALLMLSSFSNARTIEVDVYGMTCELCVDTLENKFKDMKNVSNINISLEKNMIRLETTDDDSMVTTIKQAILDAGFTPTKVRIDDMESE